MLIESDVLVAYFKKEDWLKSSAEKVLNRVIRGELGQVITDSEVIHEFYYVFREYTTTIKIQEIITYLFTLKNIQIVPVSTEHYLAALTIMETYKVSSIFDAIHAAVALSNENPDKIIISTDNVYDRISDLKRIDPRDI